ncbi:MAG TPA: RNA polymerase sigma factor [Gaiellaceae bacterium]|nr:RNA polymerase sigma factor [Gaiellaceae bacterium]
MTAEPQLAEELFNEHHRRIYAYCLRRLGSPEEADDAVQATYLNACRSLMTGFEPDAAQAWLYKVAENVCLTRQRSSYRRARVERPQDLQTVQDVVAAPEARGDELFGLEDALAGLPEQQRQAILLREWQGLSYREVGAKLGLTQAAVETLIFRARRSLASALERPAERRRLLHSFAPGNVLAALKSGLAGNLSASVASAVAVAVSATTLGAVPFARAFDSARQPTAIEPAVSAPLPLRPTLADRDAIPTPVSPSGTRAVPEHSRAAGKGKHKHGEHAKASKPHRAKPSPSSKEMVKPPNSPQAAEHAASNSQAFSHAYGRGGKKG